MKAYDAVREAATKAGTNITSLSLACGKKSNAISDAIHKGRNSSTTLISEYLEKCGYILAAVPKGDLPDGALVIDGKDQDDVRGK